jgi:CHAT domain-containing protein/tetratricopeptide (TPR) repeat protein
MKGIVRERRSLPPPAIAGVVLLLGLVASRLSASPVTCAEIVEKTALINEYQWTQRGGEIHVLSLPAIAGTGALLRVAEQGVDVDLEISQGTVLTRTANPLGRAAAQYALISSSPLSPVSLRIAAKGPVSTSGVVRVSVSALPEGGTCLAALKHWAAADMAYAAGRRIELGEAVAGAPSAASQSHDDYMTALREYESARDLLGTQSPLDRADLELNEAAIDYYELQEWSSSAVSASHAAHELAVLGEPYLRARAEAILAAAWLEGGLSTPSGRGSETPDEYQQRVRRSRRLLSRLADFHARRHESYDETLQINNIGLSYYHEGAFAKALPYFARAQDGFLRLDDTTRLATALQNQALCEWGLGRLSRAVDLFDRARTLVAGTSRPNLYLLIVNNGALAHYAAGQFDAALALEMEALDFATRTQAERARARSYFGLGLIYYAVGDRELASRFLRSALEICTSDLDVYTRLSTLRALAVIEHEQGDFTAAIGHNSEALSLATFPTARARILVGLATDYEDAGARGDALQRLDDLLAHPNPDDPGVAGLALAERGRILRRQGDWPGASRDLARALELLRRDEALSEQFDTEVELARLRIDQRRDVQAFNLLRDALRLSSEIRMQTANPEYRSSLSGSERPALELAVALLWRRHEAAHESAEGPEALRLAAQALQLVDDARARAFDEWHAERFDAAGDRNVGRLLAERSQLYRDMAGRRFELTAREDASGTNDARAAALRAQIGRLRAKAGVIEAALGAIHPGQDQSGTHTAESHREAYLPVSRGAQADSQWSHRQAPVFVEYWLGEHDAYAWVAHDGRLDWRSLGSANPIDAAARRLHDDMRSPHASSALRREDLAVLSKLVLVPLSPLLTPAQISDSSQPLAQELIIFPDGALHFVPFEALHGTGGAGEDAQYLVQQFSVGIGTALRHFEQAASAASPRPVRAERMLLVADPVYSETDVRAPPWERAAATAATATYDPRALRGSASDVRLPATAQEARDIAAIYGDQRVDMLMGLDATREAVLGKDLSAYRFVHIASHGIADAEVPQLSALVLGRFGRGGRVRDPYIRAADLLEHTFDAQAVVLSACDSSLGKEFTAEGIVGLRYAALARGARSVVASLWPVTDGITAELMTEMYRTVTSSDARPSSDPDDRSATAVVRGLSAAQRDVLRRKPGLDPALWAPFQVYLAGF